MKSSEAKPSDPYETIYIQLPPCVSRKVKYLIGQMHNVIGSKKQTKMLCILIDRWFMQLAMLSNNDLDILADDE
jgi:hypothetical protein